MHIDMNYQDIIKNALVEHDGATPVIRYLLENTLHVGYQPIDDYTRTTLNFRNKYTNEPVISTEVEILAIYYENMKLWNWAWYHPELHTSENFLSKEILMYSFKLDKYLSFIKIMLSTPRYRLKDTIQIDINLAVSTSIIKEPYVYPYLHKAGDHTVVYYLILLNKPELNKIRDNLSRT